MKGFWFIYLSLLLIVQLQRPILAQSSSDFVDLENQNKQRKQKSTEKSNVDGSDLGNGYRNKKKYNIVQDIISLKNTEREIDGSKNNLKYPDWGAFFIPYKRIDQYNSYKDNMSLIRDDLVNPRTISNIVGKQKGPVKISKLGYNLAFVTFSQFIDHQITYAEHTVESWEMKYARPGTNTTSTSYNLSIPKGDPIFDPDSTGNAKFQIQRTIATVGVRNQINQNTAWIDGRAIYGKTPQVQQLVRSFKNGKLKTSPQNLLFRTKDGVLTAGDHRVAENAALTAYHIIFVREHNRLCDLIISQNPQLTDQQVFKAARNYVIGLLQKITYDDFLPKLLGQKSFKKFIGSYKGYDQKVNPNLFNEFAAGSYRIGHSLLVDNFPQIDENNKIVSSDKLSDLLHKQNFINSNNKLETTLRGVIRTPMKEKNCWMVDQVRNFLVTDEPDITMKGDLFAFNVERGREHGLPTYNQVRQSVGLDPYVSFEQITPEFAKDLKAVHKNIWDVELFTGIICEKPLPYSVVGIVGAVMIGDGFKRIRDGDRLWYECEYPRSVVKEIKSTTLSDIIMRNTGMKNLPKDIFIVPRY